jgi:uncharacterized membrane protein YqhA
MKKFEQMFEGMLWQSRFVVLFAVIASLVSALAMFYMATVDAFFMVAHLADYASSQLDFVARNELRGTTITHVVEIVDGYLLATVLLIFSLGLYELFISPIDQANKSETASNVLLISSLDDLKNRLAKVILMILIVKFFEYAIGMHYKTPMDMLFLSGGIAFIGLALFLTHISERHVTKPEH